MATVKAQSIRPAKILLVEDEEGVLITLRDRLLSEGYVVDFAADGEAGLQKAFSLTFDLIVLDIMLPARDGLSVCREIRKAGINTPILVAALPQKLESDPTQPELIVTVPKIGYKFAEHKEDSLRDLRHSQKSE